MKNLVEQFLSDEDLSEKVGAANQARIRSEFTVAAMVDAYRSLYRTVLKRGQAPKVRSTLRAVPAFGA